MNNADIAVGTTNFQDAADLGAEWAIAGYDVRHKLALLGVWEMPFFKDSTGVTRTLLGGWQIAGSAIFQTGNRSTSPGAARFRPATTTPTATAAIGPTRRRAA